MNISPNWLVASAAAAFTLFDASANEAVAHERSATAACVETTVLEDLAAGMREFLRAVTPVITLPAIEIALPTLLPERS